MISEATEKINNGFVLSRLDNPFYDKTIGLRNSGVKFKMSEWEKNEYIRCALDIHYFSQKYCYVKGDDGQPTIIELRDYQKEILDNFSNNRFNILMASRQVGKCFSFDTKIFVKIDNKNIEISIGEFYYFLLSKRRRLTFLEKIKLYLLKTISYLKGSH